MTKSRDTADILEDVKVDGNVTAVGQETLKDNTGTHNTGVGYRAMFNSSMSGASNVALGNYNLYSNTSGANNTALGYQSLFSNTTASNNTAVGYQSLYANLQSPNSAFGAYSLLNNTNGYSNNAFGISSLRNNTAGTRNSAFGESSLNSNTTGANNTAMGNNALQSNTTGLANVSLGYISGEDNTTGTNNVYIGSYAGKNITTSNQNTLVGGSAGETTTGGSNTFIGYASGWKVSSGTNNTFLGGYNGNQESLDLRTSSNNIVLSDGAGNPRMHVDSGGNVGIGKNADAAYKMSVFTGAMQSQLNLGRNTDGSMRTAVGFYSQSQSSTVGSIKMSNSSVQYNTSSDHRLKENVSYTWDATTRLKQLKPARFNFIADADTTVDGFLAHEAQTVVPEAVSGTHNEVDSDGNPKYQGIDQSKLVPLLVKTIQELEARITALEGA